MKKLILSLIIVILVCIGIFIYKSSNNYDGEYQIYVEMIDDMSPDRKLIVKRNGKETLKYKYILYEMKDKKVILCSSENPTVNVFSLDTDELKVVLLNDDEKIAKIVKE